MISVSNDFIYAADQPVQHRDTYLTDGSDEITNADDLKSVYIKGLGTLCKSIMRYGQAEFYGTHNYLDSYVNIGSGLVKAPITDKGVVTVTIANPAVGTLTAHGLNTGDKVKFTTTGALPTGLNTTSYYYIIKINANTFNIAATLNDAYNDVKITTTGSQSGIHHLIWYPYTFTGSTEYIDYGIFKVTEQKSDKATNVITAKFFDKMYEALQLFDLSLSYPVTNLQLLQAICTRLSWTLATGSDSFPNNTVSITEDLFTTQQFTFRQVLDQIAASAGSIILFNNDDELVVKQVSISSTVDTLDSDVLISLDLKTKYGPINSIVLSRQPQEDNIADQDATSIAINGLTEFKISNNDIVDPDRETNIVPIYNAMDGLYFYPFEATTTGLGYYEIGDRIIVEDTASNQFQTVILGIELNFTGALEEILIADIPDATNTNYQIAGILGQRIKRAEIIVNKVDGEITQTVEDVGEMQDDITTLQQLADQFSIAIEGIGGTNLLKNSVGLKGTITEWQELDSAGSPTDARNNGTVTQTTDVINNSESGSSISITNQFILQSLPTIIGETYTFYCRFNKTGTCTATITGVGDVVITTDGYVSSTWDTFKLQFTATANLTTLKINTAAAITAIITDIVLKLGDANGWSQAPNEVYGKNFLFDKDGFTVTDLSSTFKAVLTNTQLAIYDTSSGTPRIVMLVSKDSGRITKLTAQDELKIQRYENPSKALRLLPVDDGVFVIIDD